MYAVIRAGGKQYRVSPGDVIRVEKLRPSEQNGNVQFPEVLAVSAADGQIGKPQSGALVTGRIVEQGRDDKILVFHYKRKKQYKKLFGHRQPFTAVRITEIKFDGQRFAAPEEPEKKAKPKKVAETQTELVAAEETETKRAPKPKAQASGATDAGKKTAGTRHGGGAKKSKASAPSASKKKKK
jgi:large subunit ribosomal protein L21